jgi:hypothetical protein
MSQEDGFECNGVSNMLNHSFVPCSSTGYDRNRLKGCDVETGFARMLWAEGRIVIKQPAAQQAKSVHMYLYVTVKVKVVRVLATPRERCGTFCYI